MQTLSKYPNEIELANAIKEFVLSNLNAHYSPKQLAEKFAVKKNFIKVKLPLLLNNTLATLLKQRRMEVAIQLINENVKIEVITQKLGYANAPHFIRAFKKHYGAPPYTWLKDNTKPQ
jgi:two-component system response regulator YesN